MLIKQLFENDDTITEDDLVEAIYVAIAYLSDAYHLDEKGINEGYCYDFVDEVRTYLKNVNGPEAAKAIKQVEDDNFPENLTAHTWIMFKGKHYDAEVPHGVDNHLELPIFKRHMKS